MKHILNNLSEEEKNSIREQHTGGMKVMTENFSKLTNSKLGDSKPFITESNLEEDDLSGGALGLDIRKHPFFKQMMDDFMGDGVEIIKYVPNKQLVTNMYTITKGR